jgi:dienelactone hydrolase
LVGSFASEMAKAEADFRFFNYAGALHSFTNPDADDYAKRFDMPIAYNAEADRRSWEELKLFLREIFAQ